MKIVIHRSQDSIDLTTSAGERVLDALDEAEAVPAFVSCRSANCGVCLALVRSGLVHLASASVVEVDTLRAIGAPAGARLLCQAQIVADATPADLIEFELLPPPAPARG